LISCHRKNQNSVTAHDSPEVAKEIIMMTWDFIYNCCLERSNCKHVKLSEPVNRQKEKIIEIILGESKKWNTKYVRKAK
jgi:hypothetical protein